MVEDVQKLEFWNSRADLGEIAGTNDFPLKELELKLIHEKVAPGSSVLDVGCGNGHTLMSLVMNKGCSGVGVDFSEKMIELAQRNCRAAGRDSEVKFQRGAIPGLPAGLGEFDYALTERCLINLDGEARQQQAFREIMSHLKPGGYYLMIESCFQGLERTNELREMLELERMEPPWHNVFLDESSVPNWATTEFTLEEVIPFSSTYHFLSRVVYARLAADKGEPLRYDSDINMLACRLPAIGDFGPARLWLWLREPTS
jgi:ubiquinone/menaquinone biosynthesis C-methylase UbiE